MKQKLGYYGLFVDSCAKYPSNVAVRLYENDQYKNYTYSELYGVCEYICQNLEQLHSKKGIIGLISDINILIPCVIAAVHKCSTTFMFLDATQDIKIVLNKINIKTIIVIGVSGSSMTSQLLNQSPDITLSVFNLTISFYDFNMKISHNKSQYSEKHSFICMTSGSTGEKKHIQVPVQCILPNVEDLTSLFNITPKDLIYFSTPLTFDPSMVEIMLACKNGASLVIAPEDPNILFPLDKKNSITFWQTTPSRFFQQSNNDIKQKILCKNSTLRCLALGGEALFGIRTLKELKSPHNKTNIYILYGVTEMSCWACATELDLEKIKNDNDVPLGECLSETQMHVEHTKKNKPFGKIVLSSQSRKCTVLNGSYCNDTNLTHYVDTGDLGEIRDNKVYFRGRTDDVIKRFGHKINTKFIEMNVMRCPEVKQCSCIWLPKPSLLVVYYTSDTVRTKELLNYIRCKLDDKHWPDRMIRIDNLPINCHGKVSKQSLCSLFQDGEITKNPPLLTKLNIRPFFETQLKEIINSNINYNFIKNKDFFSIGGTSFYAVLMCNAITQNYPAFGKMLLPLLLSRNNTIEMIIQNIEATLFNNEKKIKRKIKVDLDDHSVSKRSSVGTFNSKKSLMPKLSPEHVNRIIKPIEFSVHWCYDTGKCVDASPTLFETDTKSYITVGSHSGKIVILDAEAGNLLGLLDMKSRVEASVYCYLAEDTSARGIVGTHDGTIVSFALDSAEQIWLLNVKHMIKSKAVTYKNLGYVATYQGVVYCINAEDGRILKTINVSTHPISADLILAKNEFILMASLSGDCASLHMSTNTLVWRQKLNSPVFSNPVIYDNDKYVIFIEINGAIHCRTVEKGLKVWQFDEAKGNIFSSIYFKELCKTKWQMTFGCYDSKIYSILIDKFQPKLLWTIDVSSQVYCTPCGLNETLLLAATNNGCLYVLDSKNGAVVDTYSLPNETFSSPTVFKNIIYIGCRNDNVYSIKFKINKIKTKRILGISS